MDWNVFNTCLVISGTIIALYQLGIRNRTLRLQYDAHLAQYEWNRRKEAHDFLNSILLGRFSDLRKPFEKQVKFWETEHCDVDDICEQDSETLETLLNHLEEVCLASKDGIIDNDILFDCAEFTIRKYYKWSKPFIEQSQEKHSERLWVYLQQTALAWEARLELERPVAIPARELPKLRSVDETPPSELLNYPPIMVCAAISLLSLAIALFAITRSYP